MDIPPEKLTGESLLDPDWPSKGLIQFHNVTLRYMPSLPPALSDVSFIIPEGSQVSKSKASWLSNKICLDNYYIMFLWSGWNYWKNWCWKIKYLECVISSQPSLQWMCCSGRRKHCYSSCSRSPV